MNLCTWLECAEPFDLALPGALTWAEPERPDRTLFVVRRLVSTPCAG